MFFLMGQIKNRAKVEIFTEKIMWGGDLTPSSYATVLGCCPLPPLHPCCTMKLHNQTSNSTLKPSPQLHFTYNLLSYTNPLIYIESLTEHLHTLHPVLKAPLHYFTLTLIQQTSTGQLMQGKNYFAVQ